MFLVQMLCLIVENFTPPDCTSSVHRLSAYACADIPDVTNHLILRFNNCRSERGNVEAVKVLLEFKADANLADAFNTVILTCCKWSSPAHCVWSQRCLKVPLFSYKYCEANCANSSVVVPTKSFWTSICLYRLYPSNFRNRMEAAEESCSIT